MSVSVCDHRTRDTEVTRFFIYHSFSRDARTSHNRHIISRIIVYFLNTMFLHMTLGNLCYFNPVTMYSKEFETEAFFKIKWKCARNFSVCLKEKRRWSKIWKGTLFRFYTITPVMGTLSARWRAHGHRGMHSAYNDEVRERENDTEFIFPFLTDERDTYRLLQ